VHTTQATSNPASCCVVPMADAVIEASRRTWRASTPSRRGCFGVAVMRGRLWTIHLPPLSLIRRVRRQPVRPSTRSSTDSPTPKSPRSGAWSARGWSTPHARHQRPPALRTLALPPEGRVDDRGRGQALHVCLPADRVAPALCDVAGGALSLPASIAGLREARLPLLPPGDQPLQDAAGSQAISRSTFVASGRYHYEGACRDSQTTGKAV
jgi:hypothetical protein